MGRGIIIVLRSLPNSAKSPRSPSSDYFNYLSILATSQVTKIAMLIKVNKFEIVVSSKFNSFWQNGLAGFLSSFITEDLRGQLSSSSKSESTVFDA